MQQDELQFIDIEEGFAPHAAVNAVLAKAEQICQAAYELFGTHYAAHFINDAALQY